MKSMLAPIVVLLVAMASTVAAQPIPDAAEATFHAAVARYLELHDRVKSEVPSLTVTTNGAEISRTSDTIAAALQRARRDARPGDIFNPEVTKLITLRLRERLAGEDINRLLVLINDEPTLKAAPTIHMRYPAASSMATTPTRLLDVLPRLPEALEYRFLGRALVLRDRDAAMIVDYIVDVLPRR